MVGISRSKAIVMIYVLLQMNLLAWFVARFWIFSDGSLMWNLRTPQWVIKRSFPSWLQQPLSQTVRGEMGKPVVTWEKLTLALACIGNVFARRLFIWWIFGDYFSPPPSTSPVIPSKTSKIWMVFTLKCSFFKRKFVSMATPSDRSTTIDWGTTHGDNHRPVIWSILGIVPQCLAISVGNIRLNQDKKSGFPRHWDNVTS